MGAVATQSTGPKCPRPSDKAVNGQENPVDTIFANKLYETQSHLMLTSHILGAELVVVNDAACRSSRRAAGPAYRAPTKSARRRPDDAGQRASYTKQLADKG